MAPKRTVVVLEETRKVRARVGHATDELANDGSTRRQLPLSWLRQSLRLEVHVSITFDHGLRSSTYHQLKPS